MTKPRDRPENADKVQVSLWLPRGAYEALTALQSLYLKDDAVRASLGYSGDLPNTLGLLPDRLGQAQALSLALLRELASLKKKRKGRR